MNERLEQDAPKLQDPGYQRVAVQHGQYGRMAGGNGEFKGFSRPRQP